MQPKVKKPQSRQGQKAKKDLAFPLEKENFVIIAAGIIILVIGYLLMNQNSVDGFVPTVISPILLFLGYCVIIPYGILKGHKFTKAADPAGSVFTDNPNAVPDTGKSNIKTS